MAVKYDFTFSDDEYAEQIAAAVARRGWESGLTHDALCCAYILAFDARRRVPDGGAIELAARFSAECQACDFDAHVVYACAILSDAQSFERYLRADAIHRGSVVDIDDRRQRT